MCSNNSTPKSPRVASPALFPDEYKALTPFGRVAVLADLTAGLPPCFHDGMTLADGAILTGLPLAEVTRRYHEMKRHPDSRAYAREFLCAGLGQGEARADDLARPAPAAAPAAPSLPAWGASYRAAPNAILRSALFSASPFKGDRLYLKEAEVYSVSGLRIRYTGQQLDQSDLDVYLELLNLARAAPIGEPIEFSAHSMLSALGRSTGGKDYLWLYDALHRLCAGLVKLRDHEAFYSGHLLTSVAGLRDGQPVLDSASRYVVTLNPAFAVLFSGSKWSKLDLSTRRALGRSGTAKALHAYYSTHLDPMPHSVATLAALAGLSAASPRQTKARLLKAHQALQDAGFLAAFEESAPNMIRVEIGTLLPSQGRAAAARRAAKPRRGLAAVVGLLPKKPN